MLRSVIIAFLMMASALMAQKGDPNKILEEVKTKFDKVKDYSVDAHIKVSADFIKVPDMKAKIYFRQPDKMKLDAQGFAMLPRQAFNFSPGRMLDGNYNAIHSGTEKIDNRELTKIKIIPLSDTSEIVLSTLWIDTEKDVIRKVESMPKRGGSFGFTLNYDDKTGYPLPSRIVFQFDISNMQPGVTRKAENDGKQQKKPGGGNIVITYSNYSVNKGIPDSVFKEKKK